MRDDMGVQLIWSDLRRECSYDPDGIGVSLSRLSEAQNHRCAYCGKIMDHPTRDHIIPRSKGGAHSWINIVAACQECNKMKGTQPPHSFYVQKNGGDVMALYNDLLPLYAECIR
jgi:5-methylcytosine-specific restriction endonuclease McrA